MDQALVGVSRIGLDTSPFIYYVEDHPRYADTIEQLFRLTEIARLEAVTSCITLTEVLTLPLRSGADRLVELYRNLLLGSYHVHVVDIDVAVAERAASLRARYGLRTPDAIQVAAALAHGCEAFLTNDAHFRRVTDLRVLILDELVA